MGKGLHKVFKNCLKEILQDLPPMVEYGPEVSHLILEPRNFAEVKKLSDDIKKPWLKEILKEIKNLINNQNFIVKDTERDKPVNPFMDVYKAKIKSDGSLDKITLGIVVRGDL